MMTIAEQLTTLNNNLNTLDTEVTTQSDIIDEIMEALEGKAVEGSTTTKTCSVYINSPYGFTAAAYTTVEDGAIVNKKVSSSQNSFTCECVCGSILFVEYPNFYDIISNEAPILYQSVTGTGVLAVFGIATNIENAVTIHYFMG